jgi:ABC-type multidrug transport system fused ATPase/permease subunit
VPPRAVEKRSGEVVQGTDSLGISIWHRFSTVPMADRILVLRGGELVEQGTHEALVAEGELYAELFQLQTAGYR